MWLWGLSAPTGPTHLNTPRSSIHTLLKPCERAIAHAQIRSGSYAVRRGWTMRAIHEAQRAMLMTLTRASSLGGPTPFCIIRNNGLPVRHGGQNGDMGTKT